LIHSMLRPLMLTLCVLLAMPATSRAQAGSDPNPQFYLGMGVGVSNPQTTSALLLEPTLALTFIDRFGKGFMAQGVGIKANAQFVEDHSRVGLAIDGFWTFFGGELGMVSQVAPGGSGARHLGVQAGVFLTLARALSVYGRQVYIPSSAQSLHTDVGVLLMISTEDLEDITDIIEFFFP